MPRVAKPTLDIKWTPDPIVFGESIMDVANALEGTIVPLTAARSEVQMDIKERFATRTAPDGSSWDPWKPSYLEEAEAFPNIGMLRQSDVMYQWVTSEEALVVTNDTLFLEVPLLPPSVKKSGAKRKRSERRIYYHQEGSGVYPARPFLGMDAETRTFVFATFGEWFNRAVQLFPKKGGGIGQRHQLRSPSSVGRFVKRSTPLPVRIR
jgi:hypothetical protein